MLSDRNGCSTCESGSENYEAFTRGFGRRKMKAVQYDYRTPSGKLFSCVAPNLKQAREKRDKWLNS